MWMWGAELNPRGRERPADEVEEPTDEVEEDQYKDWPRTKEGHCILPAAPNGKGRSKSRGRSSDKSGD